MIYQPQADEFADGDAATKLILDQDPEADPWLLGWQEGDVVNADGQSRPGWIRYDGKIQ